MNEQFSTEQEAFWAGEFGDAYSIRNQHPEAPAQAAAFLSQALRCAGPISSAIELGANVGLNMLALQRLYPHAMLDAVEINPYAVRQLQSMLGESRAHQSSLLDFVPTTQWDLVICKGVLIHLAPASLSRAYDVIRRCAKRYVLIAEYYAQQPESILYRGISERLWRRDFAGELLDAYDDLALVDYGFAYHRDERTAQDDLTWFLLDVNTGRW